MIWFILLYLWASVSVFATLGLSMLTGFFSFDLGDLLILVVASIFWPLIIPFFLLLVLIDLVNG